jgi:hypothetical protein
MVAWETGWEGKMPLQGKPEALALHPSPPLAPAEDATVAAMAERIDLTRLKSGADALRALRDAFPDVPLSLRVAALAILQRQGRLGAPPAGRIH